MKRRVVVYDFSDREREDIKRFAEQDNRTVSTWIADAVRNILKGRYRVEARNAASSTETP